MKACQTERRSKASLQRSSKQPGVCLQETTQSRLKDEAFNWTPCNYGEAGKFSLHLVVSTHSPQMVYHSNLAPPANVQGTGHLARRLAKLLPPRFAELIDQSVYTGNRGMRMPYCSKPATPDRPLIPLDTSKPLTDSIIT